MSKKRDKETLDRINATHDAIFNEIESVPLEEIQRSLAEMGVERERLRAKLHERATSLARRLRANGQSAPPGLTELVEQTGDFKTLPADPTRALNKAKQYLAGLLGSRKPGAPAIVGAFRGKGDLTERDQQTIDEIDAELRVRAEAEDDQSKT